MKKILIPLIILILAMNTMPETHESDICYNENETIEDLEIGSQIVDIFNCKIIRSKANIEYLLTAFYFLAIFSSIGIGLIALFIIIIHLTKR